jgi:RNA polymerase sigma-70 factor (ECF subfamily)
MTSDAAPEDLRTLVRRCLLGDQNAMLALVDRFRGQVFGLCFRMLGRSEDAEDAAQETFIRVLKNLHRWDAERDFEPWLLAIAGNRCRTALSVRRRRAHSGDAGLEQLPDHRHEEDSASALAEEVTLALEDVRPDYRQAFLLFHQHQLSYEQIAQALNVPLGTVKTWVHRARKAMIDRLRERGVVEGERNAV